MNIILYNETQKIYIYILFPECTALSFSRTLRGSENIKVVTTLLYVFALAE